MGMSAQEALQAMGGSLHISTVRNWERNNKGVADRIAELCKMAAKNAIIKTGLDREWVITRLMAVADRCMQAEPVLVRGEPTGEYQFDSGGANTALRLLGTELGMFKPAEKKEGDEYENLSTEDLERIAYELAGQLGLPTPSKALIIDQ